MQIGTRFLLVFDAFVFTPVIFLVPFGRMPNPEPVVSVGHYSIKVKMNKSQIALIFMVGS